MIDWLHKRKPRRREDEEALEAAGQIAFADMAKQATPEALDQIESEERSAAQSQSQRDAASSRPKIRTEQITVRLEPHVLELLERLAADAGKMTRNRKTGQIRGAPADGLHILAKRYLELTQ